MVVLVLALAGTATAAGPSDRLDHFRDLARTYAETPEHGVDGPLLSELFRIVDAEIADNLRSGEPFSSTAFIQSRLDAFSDEWGGASFKVTEPSGGVRRAPVIGLFTLTYGEPRSSLRIYDRGGGAARGVDACWPPRASPVALDPAVPRELDRCADEHRRPSGLARTLECAWDIISASRLEQRRGVPGRAFGDRFVVTGWPARRAL